MNAARGRSHCKSLSLVPERLVYFRKIQHAAFPGKKQRFSHLFHLNSNGVMKAKRGRTSASPSPRRGHVRLDTGKGKRIFLFKIREVGANKN